MDKDIPRFCLDFDQRVLDKKLSKDTHRIFKRNIDQILILMLSPYLYFNVGLTYTFTKILIQVANQIKIKM